MQSLPHYQFLIDFSLSVNEKYFSNTNESVKLLIEIIVPYIKKSVNQKFLERDKKLLW